jgi:hypothetical protein
MRTVVRLLFFVSHLLIYQACTPGGKESVQTGGAGIASKYLYQFDGRDGSGTKIDFGEMLLMDEDRLLEVIVTNSSQYPFDKIELKIESMDDKTPAIQFVPKETGEIEFPGFGGTCGQVLTAGKSCKIMLLLRPTNNRRYTDKVTLSYHNLLNQQSHVTETTVLAGEPASLVFITADGDTDDGVYNFGDIVGTQNKKSVVERAEANTYTQTLIIKNGGGLSARNLSVKVEEDCMSALTGQCPDGMDGAYTITSDCPKRLEPNQICNATVTYKPKNQDPMFLIGEPDEEIVEVSYNSTAKFSYVTGPKNQATTLNGFFSSVSATIEAKFIMALDAISFDTPIISGNRDMRAYTLRNDGFREGELHELIFKENSQIKAKCKGEGSEWLKCYSDAGVALALEDFPFTVKDKTSCVKGSSAETVLVPVGGTCQIELYFQPSVKYLTNRNIVDWDSIVKFDTRWSGQETIKERNLYKLSAKSKSAARLELSRIVYAPVPTIPVTKEATYFKADLGTITLQSKKFIRRSKLSVKFKNMGNTPATAVTAKDGQNAVITKVASTLGINNPKYYIDARLEDDCDLVAPGDECTLSASFAPIALGDIDDENENLYDDAANKFKGFSLTYNSSELYSDANTTDDASDISSRSVDARVYSIALRRGKLMHPEEDPRNIKAYLDLRAGDRAKTYFFLQNMGSWHIPYIKMNDIPNSVKGYEFVATTSQEISDLNDLGLEVNHDCLNLVDRVPFQDILVTITNTQLGIDESCVFTVKTKLDNSFLTNNPFNATTEFARLFSRNLTSVELQEFSQTLTNAIFWTNSFDAFDGFNSLTSNLPVGYNALLGSLMTTTVFSQNFTVQSPARLVPNTPVPWFSATIFRRNYALPGSFNVPEMWLYGSNLTAVNDATKPTLMRSDLSRNFANTLSSSSNFSSYDYVYFVGSFPQNSGSVDIPITLSNTSIGTNAAAKLKSFTLTPAANAFTLTSSSPVINSFIASNSFIRPNFRFNPTVAGVNEMVIDYEYETGVCDDELVYFSAARPGCSNPKTQSIKILLLAHVAETGFYPELSAKWTDYDVTPNGSSSPIISGPLDTTSVPADGFTWNLFQPNNSAIFESIRLTSTPKVSDVFIQKVLTFKNESAQSVSPRFFLRGTSTDQTTLSLPSLTFATGSTCLAANLTLTSNQECNLVVRYQPVSSDTLRNVVISALYDLGNNQFVMKNVGISLIPLSPANVVAEFSTGTASIPTQSISWNSTPGPAANVNGSYLLTIPLNELINAATKTYEFSSTATTGFRRLRLRNTQLSSASLLKSYQNYVTQKSLRGYSPGNPAPSSLIPAAGEYETLVGEAYVKIVDLWGGRLVVKANKACLFGNDENNALVPAHKKGFNSSSSLPCYLIPSLTVGVNDFGLNLDRLNADIMRENSAPIEYFSVNRSSVSRFHFHFSGSFQPPTSIASSGYSQVTAESTRVVRFRLPAISVNHSAMGDLVGVRVLMSTAETDLRSTCDSLKCSFSDIYKTTNLYYDLRPANPLELTDSNIENFVQFLAPQAGRLYYIKLAAIRRNNSFTKHARYQNLNSNEFLSVIDNGNYNIPMRIVIPLGVSGTFPLGTYYSHSTRKLIERGVSGSAVTHPQAVSVCTGKTTSLSINNVNTGYVPRLIDMDTWSVLKNVPQASSYTNLLEVMHWLSNPTVSIQTKFGSYQDYSSNELYQNFLNTKEAYWRNPQNLTAPVNLMVGGAYNLPNSSDFTSYMHSTWPVARARCMIDLAPIYGTNPW